jgi:predicted HicB family RNase H-like nuclease
MNAQLYTYRVFWSPEDEEFVGVCAEFPNLSWLDPDQATAFSGIVSLVQSCLDDAHSHGESVPEPFSQKQFSGKFMVRIPPQQHRQLTLQAAEQGISLKRLVTSKLSL